MDLRSRVVAGAVVVATAVVGLLLESLGLSRLWLLLVLVVCIVIIVWAVRAVALSWGEIESRFVGLSARDIEPEHKAGRVRAEHVQQPDGTWRWELDGGTTDRRREAERLCVIAGNRLARSRKIARTRTFSRTASDDFSRWLYFLIDIGEGENDKSVRLDSAGTFLRSSDDAATTYPYSIPNLVQASRSGCLECIKREHAPSQRGGVA